MFTLVPSPEFAVYVTSVTRSDGAERLLGAYVLVLAETDVEAWQSVCGMLDELSAVDVAWAEVPGSARPVSGDSTCRLNVDIDGVYEVDTGTIAALSVKRASVATVVDWLEAGITPAVAPLACNAVLQHHHLATEWADVEVLRAAAPQDMVTLRHANGNGVSRQDWRDAA